MGNIKNSKKTEKVISIQDVGSLAKYANALFFKKKDEEAIKFLKKTLFLLISGKFSR